MYKLTLARTFQFFLLFSIISLFFIPVVSASEVLVDSQITKNSGIPPALTFAYNGSYAQAVGQTLTLDESVTLGKVDFMYYMEGDESLDFTYRVNITGVSGTVGVDAVPNATVYATSSTIFGFAGSGAGFYYAPFIFGNETLVAGDYALNLYCYTNGTDPMQAVLFQSNSTAGSHDGNGFYAENTIYSAYADRDFAFRLFEYIVDPTPTPTPVGYTPTPDPVVEGEGDSTLEYWGDIIAVWIFPILLVLVPAVIAAYYLGKIGFIIGLNIGMILGYAALPNIFGLWTVIMLVLVDVAYFFFARDR